MSSAIGDVLFHEPHGQPNATVQFAAAVAFSGLYVWSWVEGWADSSDWLLIMVLGSSLSGVAESLPADWRLAAGVVRTVAVGVLLSLLAVLIFAPGLVY